MYINNFSLYTIHSNDTPSLNENASKEILILVQSNEILSSNTDEIALLNKILEATKTNMQQVWITSLETVQNNPSIYTNPALKKIIAFGITPNVLLGKAFSEQYVNAIFPYIQTQVLCTFPLENIKTDSTKKAILWKILKNWFNV